MNFSDLHEQLRLELLRRIQTNVLTGSRLARQTGFRQAHISNFLNRKRALSLEGLDRVLASQNLTIQEILSSSSVNLSAVAEQVGDGHLQTVPLVSPSAAMRNPVISSGDMLGEVRVSASLLQENAPRSSPARERWERFVAIRAEAQHAAAMKPHLSPGAVVILDRHYTSLALYRANQPNIYGVRCGGALQLRFAEFYEDRLILRPSNIAFPVQLQSVEPDQSPSDLIAGRACLVFNEL